MGALCTVFVAVLTVAESLPVILGQSHAAEAPSAGAQPSEWIDSVRIASDRRESDSTSSQDVGVHGSQDGPDEVETLVAWMTGSFSSAEQAAADSSYYDIRLEMVEVWKERPDGPWLYIEQAVAGSTDRPYRQRVYRISACDGRLRSDVFLLPEPGDCVGAWKLAEPLADLAAGDLELRDGCAVFLSMRESGLFEGGTEGTGCASDLRGAAYATSDVVVGKGLLKSWDRGFDLEGRQVWGAESGPYVFLRVEAETGCAEPSDAGTDP
jgi:hypothetical protein